MTVRVSALSGSPGAVQHSTWTPTLFDQTLTPLVISAGAAGIQDLVTGNGFAFIDFFIGGFQTTTAGILAIEASLPVGLNVSILNGSGANSQMVFASIANLFEPCIASILDSSFGFPFIEFARVNYPTAGLLTNGTYAGALWPTATTIKLQGQLIFPTR